MEIIEVKKYKDKVEFILKSYNGKYKVELTNRFIVCSRNSRWDFVKKRNFALLYSVRTKGLCLW